MHSSSNKYIIHDTSPNVTEEEVFEEEKDHETNHEMIIIRSEEKSHESTCDTSDDGGAGSGCSRQHNLGNITVGDIVWAKEGRGLSASDEFWWPAKVIDTRPSSNSSKVEVHWFNRDSGRHPIKIKANLIKPFMDMIQV